MSGAFFITARLGSKRLAAKHLQNVNGAPALDVLISRVENAAAFHKNNKVICAIVSGNKKENNGLESVRKNFPVFYGDDENIPRRHLEAALHFGVDFIVSVDGDDLLCSSDAMSNVYSALLNGAHYVKTEGLPFGMNSWGYSTDFLKKSLENIDVSLLETGWGRIFDEKRLKVLKVGDNSDGRIRASLDYPEDLAFFQRIFEIEPNAVNISDNELIELIVKNKIFCINQSRIEEYWSNFKRHVNEENEQ
jgi:spore coat polysaccharide biosynthesis protein SpsF (cytidylyltransferase family)